MEIRKAYKFRLYPNKAQEQELLKILAGCRFVWNYFLSKRKDYYLEHKKTIPYHILSKELTKLRKTEPVLQDIQLRPLEQSLRRLDSAYNRFFRKLSKFPDFKREEDLNSSFQKPSNWKLIGDKLQVQSSLILKTRGRLPNKTGTLVVKCVAGRWYGSISVKEKSKPKKRFTKPIGIDVGLNSLAVTSEGKKYETLKPSYDLHDRMRRLQRKMARQVIGSKRREQTRLEIARLYHRICNIRLDHLHKTSHKILEKNPSLIVLEDLNVKGMLKNHRLARSLADVSLGELHRQLKYKQEWRGGKVVVIDRFFPSTKTCSKCSYINEDIKLATRNWACPRCGVEHDRDINASRVILQQGLGKPSVETSREVVETQT